jgi:hypothetical protein
MVLTYNQAIFHMVNTINPFLPEHFQIQKENMFFSMKESETETYEDDGNTSTKGKKYDIIWSFPFCELSSYDEFYIQNMEHSEACLSFTFTATERVRDQKYKKSHFFNGYLNKFSPVDRYGKEEKTIRFCLENDNYKAASTLTNMVSAKLIPDILKMADIYTFYKKLEETK